MHPRLIQAREFFKKLEIEGIFYLIGVILLATAPLVWIFGRPETFQTHLQMSLLIFVCGLVSPCNRVYLWIWEKPAGKVLIAAAIGTATIIAHGYAKQMVSYIVSGNPSVFGDTITFATIVISPILLCMAMAFFGAPILCLGFITFTTWGFLDSIRGTKTLPRSKTLWTCRGVAWFIAFASALAILSGSNKYLAWADQQTRWYAYKFDMYPDQDFPAPTNVKIRRLEDGKTVGAWPTENGGFEFGHAQRRTQEVAK